MVAPDFMNHSAPEGMRDINATLAFFDNILRPAFPQIIVEIQDQIGESDRVTTRKILHSIHKGDFMGLKASGRNVAVKIIDIWRIVDAKLTDHWGMIDLQDLTAQIS